MVARAMTKGERTYIRVRTYMYILAMYICTYSILYPLHNSVVQGDKNETVASRESLAHLPLSQYVTHNRLST